LTNLITGFGERCDLVREGKMFVKDEAKISSTAEWEVSSEELLFWSVVFLSPMSKNSVLEKLRVRRLAGQ